MEENNIFTGKTVEEAKAAGLEALGLTEEQAEITVLEEGKKKLFGAVKAKVLVEKKISDGERAIAFIDGLMEILKVNAVAELVSDEEKIEINITSTDSNRVIGRHGEVLDSIQALAGAVANIGREEYKKVVVDCENYRSSREKTLTELANKLAKKAVEKQRRVSLEPMNPYERRIIHSALASNEEVKTISSGNDPVRFIVIIPNNEKPYEARRGEKPRRNGRANGDFRGDRKPRGARERGGDRGQRSGGAPRSGGKSGKKEIHFGTFLGNSGSSGGNDGNDGGESGE